MKAEKIIKITEIVNQIKDKKIIGIDLELDDEPFDGSIEINSITLEDGTKLNFQGSGQIGIGNVWVYLDKSEAETKP